MQQEASIKAKRVCSECGTTETYDNWRLDGKGGYLCKKCYMRNYTRKHPHYLGFKDKLLWLGAHTEPPRKGICMFCGARKGDINPKTGKPIITTRAHIKYLDNDPLKCTIELCSACHRKLDHGIPPDRKCCLCNRNWTGRDDDGNFRWYKTANEGQFLCGRCYMRRWSETHAAAGC